MRKKLNVTQNPDVKGEPSNEEIERQLGEISARYNTEQTQGRPQSPDNSLSGETNESLDKPTRYRTKKILKEEILNDVTDCFSNTFDFFLAKTEEEKVVCIKKGGKYICLAGVHLFEKHFSEKFEYLEEAYFSIALLSFALIFVWNKREKNLKAQKEAESNDNGHHGEKGNGQNNSTQSQSSVSTEASPPESVLSLR